MTFHFWERLNVIIVFYSVSGNANSMVLPDTSAVFLSLTVSIIYVERSLRIIRVKENYVLQLRPKLDYTY
jgi:hypothetical protein